MNALGAAESGESADLRPTVMVVDDTPDNLALLDHMLRAQGYRVRAFPRPALALAAALRTPPDIFLLDINMPEMTGFELCKHLKAERTLAEVPVIFISALSETSDKVRAFSAGGVDYVTKPFQFDEVEARVRAHLRIRSQQVELQAAHDRLRGLEEVRDSLVHMIVHDMRSLLTPVLSNLDWLASEPLADDARDALGDSLNASRELQDMVKSLLDVSRMEASQMTLAPALTELNALVASAVHDLAALRGARSVTLATPPGDCHLTCDTGLVRRVVINLVGNALKYVPERTGEVHIEVVKTQTGVRVTVRDNGPGIPPEFHGRIFDKFFQVNARQRGVKHSSGLGLTFCKLAVEAHGGRIGLESEGGRGSSFWFELPSAPVVRAAAQPSSESRSSSAP